MEVHKYETEKIMAQYIEAEWGDIIPITPNGGNRLHLSTPRSVNFYCRVAAAIAEFMPLEKCQLIDIGCGTGRLAFELSKLRPNATYRLYDTSKQFQLFTEALLGQRQFPSMLSVIGNVPNFLDRIPLPKGFEEYAEYFSTTDSKVLSKKPTKKKFDVVVCLNVIDRIPLSEQPEFVNWLFGLVRPGGIIAMATPYDYKDFTEEEVVNLRDLFRQKTTILKDMEQDYIMRASVRHIHHYKSHLVIGQIPLTVDDRE